MTATARAYHVEVSAIIVMWNSAQELPQCLTSLTAQDLPAAALQIICVDNGSPDDSAPIAKAAGAAILRMDRNVGFPRAVNAALGLAAGEFVLMLNPDVVLGPAVLTKCLQAFTDPSIGLVGCNLRRPDGRPDPAAARREKSLLTVALEAVGITRLYPGIDYQYFPGWLRDDDREVPCINGAFMLIRASLLKELGGLDESIFMYLEDTELCRKVRSTGHKVWFVHTATAEHVSGASTRRGDPEQVARAYIHRLHADIESVARSQGIWTRPITRSLLLIQSVAGLLAGFARGRDRDVVKYSAGTRWLLGRRGDVRLEGGI